MRKFKQKTIFIMLFSVALIFCLALSVSLSLKNSENRSLKSTISAYAVDPLDDYTKVKNFLIQKDKNGVSNAEKLQLNLEDKSTWEPFIYFEEDNLIGIRLGFNLDILNRDEYGQLYGELDLSDCAFLLEVHIAGNQISLLNVSGCSNLNRVSADNNQLTLLNVSGCDKLIYLSCKNNKLTSLDLSGLILLRDLYCNNNLIEEFNILDCEDLQIIHCHNNRLASIELNTNALPYLTIHKNPLKTSVIVDLKELELPFLSYTDNDDWHNYSIMNYDEKNLTVKCIGSGWVYGYIFEPKGDFPLQSRLWAYSDENGKFIEWKDIMGLTMVEIPNSYYDFLCDEDNMSITAVFKDLDKGVSWFAITAIIVGSIVAVGLFVFCLIWFNREKGAADNPMDSPKDL